MSAPLNDKTREIIPRWRDLRSTILLGELAPAQSEQPLISVPNRLLEETLTDWHAERTLPFAAEVVGAALVLGDPEPAYDAADFIIAHQEEASDIVIDIARRILEPAPTMPQLPVIDVGAFQRIIRQTKSLVRSDPRNAFAWVELSRAYASLGLKQKALHAIQVALELGCNNRYVLRSAARLFTHIGDPARAHRTLTRSDATQFDPWLIAAEIGTAGLSDKSPKFVKQGLRLADSKNILPFEASELESALGTLDSKNGHHRQARRHFRASLKQPNENALAQARWAATHNLIQVNPGIFEAPRAFEARTWSAFYAGDWATALAASKNWMCDQPFSASPAVHASYVAAVGLQDYREAVRIARQGLHANPKDPSLLNNLCFALANSGTLLEAQETLARIDRQSVSPPVRVLLTATAGLLAYRMGNPTEGRQLYESALSTAEDMGDSRLKAKAAIFFALEALRADDEGAVETAERAIHLASEYQNADFDWLRVRLTDAIAKRSPRSG